LTKNNRTKRKKNNNLYAKIRINAAKDDREELDLVEAAYDFNRSPLPRISNGHIRKM
jgi:hypothetical protein